MNWLRRRSKMDAPGTDLSGRPVPDPDSGRPAAHVIADRLREMSETAFRAGLETASGMIELSALVTEMEGDRPEQQVKRQPVPGKKTGD